MKLYKKYLISNLFKPFLISLLTLITIIWSTRFIKFMDYIVQDGVEFFTFFKLTIYILPSLIITILPLSIILTSILTYNKLIENKELIILKNCGISKLKLLYPLILISVFITLSSYLITFYLGYKSNLAIRKLRNDIQNNISFSLIKDGVFSNFKNFVIYADKKVDNKIYNILVYNKKIENSTEENIIIQAQLAEINQNIITLYNGNFQKFIKKENNNPDLIFFDEYNVNFADLTNEKREIYIRHDSLSIIQLIKILKNEELLKKYRKNVLIYEINFRIFFPLLSIILALLSGSIMLEGGYNRVSNSKTLIKTSLISLFSFLFLLFLFQKVKSNSLFLIFLYLSMIFITIYSFYLIKEKKTI